MAKEMNQPQSVFSRKNTGQNLTELALVCGLVILTSVFALTQSGTQISGIFNKVDNGMKTALINPNQTGNESTGSLGVRHAIDATGVNGGAIDGPNADSNNNWSSLHGIPKDRNSSGKTGSEKTSNPTPTSQMPVQEWTHFDVTGARGMEASKDMPASP